MTDHAFDTHALTVAMANTVSSFRSLARELSTSQDPEAEELLAWAGSVNDLVTELAHRMTELLTVRERGDA